MAAVSRTPLAFSACVVHDFIGTVLLATAKATYAVAPPAAPLSAATTAATVADTVATAAAAAAAAAVALWRKAAE